MMFDYFWKCPQCEDGYYWNDNDEYFPFGGCTNECTDIHDMCTKCDLKGDQCLACEHGYMPEADGSTCVEYFKHCKQTIEEQTEGKLPQENGKWACTTCLPGYFWWSQERICLECGIDKCSECQDIEGDVLCTKCVNGYLPTFDGLGCQTPIEHCNVPQKLQV